MALPFSFSSELQWSDHRAHQHLGVNGSDLYAILRDNTNNTLEAWRSTDGGDTWSEQDSANHPATSATSGMKHQHVVASGSTLYIAYTPSGSSRMQITAFSMSSNTWQARQDSGIAPDVANNVSGTGPRLFTRRSDGSFVVLHQGTPEKVMGTEYRRAKVFYYASGAWNGPYDVQGSANSPIADTLPGHEYHYDVRSIVLGAGDRVHLTYSNTNVGNLFHRILKSDNTFLTQEGVQLSLGSAAYSVGVPMAYADGDNTKLFYPFVGATSQPLMAGRTTSADTLSWTEETISATTTSDPEYTTAPPGAAAADGTTIHTFWADDTTQDIYRDSDGGSGSWGTDTEWKDAVTCNGMNAVYFEYAGTKYVGVLYDNALTVTFDRYSLGALVTAPFPPWLQREMRSALVRM